MMKMRRLLIIFILFTAAWLLGFLAFTYRINHFRPDDGTKTDAIIVLTGGKNRISEAVKLLNDGLGDKPSFNSLFPVWQRKRRWTT